MGVNSCYTLVQILLVLLQTNDHISAICAIEDSQSREL